MSRRGETGIGIADHEAEGATAPSPAEVGMRKKEIGGEAEEEMSVEKAFEGERVPTWREQLTVRALVVSFFMSVMFSVIVMKLNLTTGIIPSLNVSAGLLGFFFVKSWTKLLEKSGFLKQPFTRQENTVIQTCVVAAYGIAFSGIYIYISSFLQIIAFVFIGSLSISNFRVLFLLSF